MQLEEYLKALGACPDKQLKNELGIYDNWPILISANYQDFSKKLLETGNYEVYDSEESEKPRMTFTNVSKTVYLQLMSWTINPFSWLGMASHEEVRKRMKDYEITLMLHPMQGGRDQGVTWLRSIALVAEEIGNLCMREKFALGMPRSIGWRYLTEDNSSQFSRVVFYEPAANH